MRDPISKSEVLNLFSASDAVLHFDNEYLLSEMSSDDIIKYLIKNNYQEDILDEISSDDIIKYLIKDNCQVEMAEAIEEHKL